MHNTTGEGWNPYSLYILVLSTLLCVLKTTDEVWDLFRLVSLVIKAQFWMKKTTQMRPGTHKDLSFWCKSRCFACTKRQVMPWTHRALLFRSISRCFASKNHTWGLGPIDTRSSDARHTVLHAQKDRWGLVSLEICKSGPKVAVLRANTTDEGWDRLRLVILMLSTLLYMHKTTRHVWDP